MRPISVDEVPSSGSERERTASSGDSKGAGGPTRRKTTAERPADQADGHVPDVNVVNMLATEVPQTGLQPTSSLESPGTFHLGTFSGAALYPPYGVPLSDSPSGLPKLYYPLLILVLGLAKILLEPIQ